jgi:acyl carrier protein
LGNDLVQDGIPSRVEGIVRQHVGSDAALPLDANLLEDLAIDSLELVELSITMEKEFGIRLPMSALRHCFTLEEIIQMVQQTKQEGQVESI